MRGRRSNYWHLARASRLQTPVSGSTSSTRSGSLAVAGDVGGDRTHLFVSRQHQEGWRAAVGFHAGEIEARLVLRQFPRAVRPHGAAAMFVRIDQRRQRDRALDGRVEPDAQFAHEIQLGAKTRGHDEFVDDDLAAATGRARADDEARAVGGELRNPEFAFHLDSSCGHQCGKRRAKLAAGGKLVVRATAKGFRGIVASQQPDRLGLRRLFREFRQIGQRADRGMSGAEHRDGLAGIARAVFSQHVGHSVGDPVRGLRLANGGEAIRARRVRRMPGAGYVDHRIGLDDFRTFPVLITDFERRRFAALGLELVEAGAADAGDAARGADVGLEGSAIRERFEIALHHLCAGRVLIGFGRIPACRGKQTHR